MGEQPKKVGRSKFFYVGLVVIALIVALFVIGALAELVTPSSVTVITTSVSTTTTSMATTSVTRTATTTTTATPGTALKVGETAKYGGLEVTITSSKVSDSYTYYSDILKKNMVETASAGKKFVLIYVEVKNGGSATQYTGTGWMDLSDSDGNKYTSTIYLGNDGFPIIQTLYPNDKVKGFVLFEVPKDATGLKLRYNFGTTGNPYLVIWNLGE
jgi:hypothetical protein